MKPSKLGEFIAAKLKLSESELKKLLTMQSYMDEKVGGIAVRRGFISNAQLKEILSLQKKNHLAFGNAGVYLGYLKNSQVKFLLDVQAQEKNRIGELLVQQKIVSQEKLLDLLDEFYSQKTTHLTILGLLKDSLADEIQEVLKPYHYKFHPCKKEEDFISLAKTLKPQLILLDQEKGKKVLQHDQKNWQFSDTRKAKVALFSRKTQKLEMLVGYKFGIDYILPRTFDPKNFINIIIDAEVHYFKKKEHRILVVDDSPTVRIAMARELRDSGFQVIFAENGKECLEIARLECPDLITMDLEMPVMDGYEACRGLKSQTDTALIPIIILTSKNTQAEREKIFEAGATEYFTKPFTKGHLSAYIQHLLSGGEEVRQEKILFADDSLIARRIYESIFKKNGFKYEMAKNGNEVLDSLKKGEEPWAIVMGCFMPEMDGFQACQKIKEDEKYRHIPVILVTAANKKEDVLNGLKLGANDYITKPFDEDELIARVEAHIKNYKLFKEIQKQNEIMLEQRKELEKEKEKAESANKIIMESIEYAARIQRTLLPNQNDIRNHIPESFFVWRPRDIVGGDIYFFRSFFNEGYLIALADCTGHGVPGAFMTMIVISCMETVLLEGCHDDPSLILKRLSLMVKSILGQDAEDASSDDGLDAAVCFVNPKEGRLQLASARLPVFYTSKGGVEIIKGDKQGLGYKKSDPFFDFKNHTIPIDADTTVYLATDGLLEQLGVETGFPFGKRRLQEFIHKHKSAPLQVQGDLLLQVFEEHKGKREMLDDVTVIGFKPLIGNSSRPS